MILGAIIGDVIGSSYEWKDYRTKNYNFELVTERTRFTDDSILTIAVLDALLEYKKLNINNLDILRRLATDKMVDYGNRNGYYGKWFGKNFLKWLANPIPYESIGNGAAMRISPVAYVADNIDEVIEYTIAITDVSHNSDQGRKAALAVSTSIFMLRNNKSLKDVIENIKRYYPNIMSIDLEKIRPEYKMDITCDGSVPIALKCFIDARSFEDALRLAISMGGDADTLAAICCSLASEYYPIPENIKEIVSSRIDSTFKELLDNLQEYISTQNSDL